MISQELPWASNIDTIIKRAKQRMYFLHQLRKFNLSQELVIHNELQQIVRTAHKIIGAKLPSIQDLYIRNGHATSLPTTTP